MYQRQVAEHVLDEPGRARGGHGRAMLKTSPRSRPERRVTQMFCVAVPPNQAFDVRDLADVVDGDQAQQVVDRRRRRPSRGTA
jgi:hypothetical protein